KRLLSWKTSETGRSAGCRSVMSRSPWKMRPLSGVSNPEIRLRSVDFPEPDGPVTAVVWPPGRWQSKWNSLPPGVRRTSSRWMPVGVSPPCTHETVFALANGTEPGEHEAYCSHEQG